MFVYFGHVCIIADKLSWDYGPKIQTETLPEHATR
jgi:hypothetical protein